LLINKYGKAAVKSGGVVAIFFGVKIGVASSMKMIGGNFKVALLINIHNQVGVVVEQEYGTQ
jgi:hypothetical protein